MAEALLATDLDLPNKRTGKVRDLYDVTLGSGDEALLIIASDRISAFDVVMQNGLPGKGVVLTQISKFWFDHFSSEINHHLISTDVADVPGLTDAERQALKGRIMLCRKTEVVPIECIARGYPILFVGEARGGLTGSTELWDGPWRIRPAAEMWEEMRGAMPSDGPVLKPFVDVVQWPGIGDQTWVICPTGPEAEILRAGHSQLRSNARAV